MGLCRARARIIRRALRHQSSARHPEKKPGVIARTVHAYPVPAPGSKRQHNGKPPKRTPAGRSAAVFATAPALIAKQMKRKVRVVCATRAGREQFFATTALGRSLAVFGPSPDCELLIYPSNTAGLPAVYNHAIEAAVAQPAILVFVHDDVYLCDFFWPDRVREALQRFDVVGVAGTVCEERDSRDGCSPTKSSPAKHPTT